MKWVKVLIGVALTLGGGNIRAQDSVPIFSNKRDSADYDAVRGAIQQIFKNQQSASSSERTSAKFDSLIRLQAGFREKIIGYRIIYNPSKDFTPYEDLRDGKVKPETITRLSLSNAKVKGLPKEVFMCRNLNELELVNTTIRRLSSKLNTLPRLQNVYVYNNVIPGRLKLGKNEMVSRFVLRGIQATSLPRSYKNFRALDSLELSQNIDLSDFPRINRNRQLVKLNLIENNITLTELKHGSSSLKELNLQKNKIRVVPAGIGAFPNLRKLGLNYNVIEDIHPNIGALKKLESLSLYQNKLQQIPVGVFELNNLLTIDMYFNNLQFVGPDIGKLSKLQILYISNNQLTALPEELGALGNLVEIYAHDNKLGALPESISKLKQLRVLRVNNNLISSLPKNLGVLTALENLDVSHNYLYKFPVEWSGLPQLKILGIMDNPWENKEEVEQIAEALRARGVLCLYSPR